MKSLVERRILTADSVSIRESRNGEPRRILGYAALFNTDSSDLGGFIERIKPGAFKKCLAKSDVRCLVNHDANLLLARTANGTLRLWSDSRGLKFEADLPDTNTARNAERSIERGDISGCSFSFCTTAGGDVWDTKNGNMIRTLVEIDKLFDVSIATYPAYPDTTVALAGLARFRAGGAGDMRRRRQRLESIESWLRR